MKNLALAGAVLTAVLTMSSANAGHVDGKWTVGGTVGYTTSSADFDNLNSSKKFGTTTINETYEDDLKGAGLKLFGEYNFNDYFSVGVAYDYLYVGKLNQYDTASNGAATVKGKKKYDISAHVFEAYAKGQYKFTDNFAVYAKAGPTLNVINLSDSSSDHDRVDSGSTVGYVAGLGAEYKFNNGIAIRAGYDYFYNVGEIKTELSSHEERINTNFFYAGASYTF